MTRYRTVRTTLVVLALVLGIAAEAAAQDGQVIFGFKVSAGGRYDDVRMGIATPAGGKGGPAMDISFFTEVGLRDNMSLLVNIPVMRPLLFGVGMKMLQFEPEVALLFRKANDGKVDLVAGPSVGVTLH